MHTQNKRYTQQKDSICTLHLGSHVRTLMLRQNRKKEQEQQLTAGNDMA